MASLFRRLRRGNILARLWGRAARETQAAITTVTLSCTRPNARRAAIVTLNPDEENASVQAVLLGQNSRFERIIIVSPSPEISISAVKLAARRLELPSPKNLSVRKLSFGSLLGAYRESGETYSTHVLLPGRDLSKARRHVHLTHGSGPKPDSTFRSPTNVLASITPHWVPQQLREYKLPPETEVIPYMPRLEILRRSVGDTAILERLGLDPFRPLVLWAPTYRVMKRGKATRVSGRPISGSAAKLVPQLRRIAADLGGTLAVKIHPHEADDYSGLGVLSFDNVSLRGRSVTPYELFGVASLVITDYSSIASEREFLGLSYLILQHDQGAFLRSDRGLRTP